MYCAEAFSGIRLIQDVRVSMYDGEINADFYAYICGSRYS